jgi:hypothetical protein
MSPLDVAAAGMQRMTLRASAALCLSLAVFVLAAACAVHLFLAPRAGLAAGVCGAAATAALLAVCALRACARRLPAAICVEASGQVAAFGRAGQLLARGSVTGCAHWSGLLLVLSVGQEGRRPRSLLIPADALDASSFRALSVLARSARAA